MIKKTILITCLTVIAFFSTGSTDVKADTATAAYMKSAIRALYQVDQAEVILNTNMANLQTCLKNHASEMEIAFAQASVNDATNLLNTLNTMVTRDCTMIEIAPAGVINPPSFAVNTMTAQGAWHDYFYRIKAYQSGVYPFPTNKKTYSVVYTPFCMY